jgi:hypothetical protein
MRHTSTHKALWMLSATMLVCTPFAASAMAQDGQAQYQGNQDASSAPPPPASNVVPDAKIEADVVKALAGVSSLATQSITSTTVYGTVTLTGMVPTEALRVQAERTASRVPNVKKVVDEITLPGEGTPADTDQQAGSQMPALATAGGVAAQDGQSQDSQTQGMPADIQNGPQQNDGQGSSSVANGQNANGAYPNSNTQQNGGSPGYANGGAPVQRTQNEPGNYGYPQTAANTGPYGQGPYRGPNAGYGTPPPPPAFTPDGRPYVAPGYGGQYAQGQNPYQGQRAGVQVTVPSGAALSVRIDQGFTTRQIKAGASFTGTLLNDVVSGGVVAIPRGSQVQGRVVDAEKAGALKGRSELVLQLNQVALGGQYYPLMSTDWSRSGGDKGLRTTNSTIGGAAIGALFGALAGGGAGAAIGAGVGGAAGLGASAASDANVWVAPESVLNFHLAQPTTVTTVSPQEMARLAQSVGPVGQPQRVLRRRYGYPTPYPYGYYGGYYR